MEKWKIFLALVALHVRRRQSKYCLFLIRETEKVGAKNDITGSKEELLMLSDYCHIALVQKEKEIGCCRDEIIERCTFGASPPFFDQTLPLLPPQKRRKRKKEGKYRKSGIVCRALHVTDGG